MTVLRASKKDLELGGHMASFQSSATIYDVCFNHFFRARNEQDGGDLAEKANGAINKMAEVIRFRLNIISLYGAKKELTYRIQTVLNATIIKVLYWLFF